jgi:hypothetical protein
MGETKTISYDESIIALRTKKYAEGAISYQERRHPDWRENYSLYRDKVQTNRLTQRQSVNVPLMKETIRTILSKTDETPDIYFESLSNDKQKEIFLNEYWKWWFIKDNFEIKDIVDKKQEGLYGRSTMKLNLFDGRPTAEVLEPYDWIVDRYADPSDLDNTAMYMGHINIFRSLSQVEANPLYEKTAVKALKEKYAEQMGLARSEENIKQLMERNERLQDLGLWDINNPVLGETYLNLSEHYIRLWSDERKKLVIFVRVTDGDTVLLMKPLEDILGINFFPFVSWADDVEKTDVYSDGVGDIVRTPNKILNSWFSQLVENRTLRNYGMTYYDATVSDKWVPQTYEPTPWGWYPTAGDPNKTTKRVDIPELSESLDEMSFVIGMVEKATASTATEKGVKESGDVTLGQIKLMLQSSNDRINSIAKFYRPARREFGEKWYKVMMANEKWITAVKLQKKSYKGNYFEEVVSPADWKDEAGYVCRVVSTSERNQKNIEEVQKIQAVSGMFPENIPLKRIMKKKALDLIDGLSQEEIDEVLDFDETSGADMNSALSDGSVPSPIQPRSPQVKGMPTT